LRLALPHCKDDPICVFLEMKLRSLVPNVLIHVSVNDLYIPSIGPPILLQQNMQIDPDTVQIHECRNWERSRAVSFLGIFFRILGTVSLQCIAFFTDKEEYGRKLCALYMVLGAHEL
jgi:hypothetical protein